MREQLTCGALEAAVPCQPCAPCTDKYIVTCGAKNTFFWRNLLL